MTDTTGTYSNVGGLLQFRGLPPFQYPPRSRVTTSARSSGFGSKCCCRVPASPMTLVTPSRPKFSFSPSPDTFRRKHRRQQQHPRQRLACTAQSEDHREGEGDKPKEGTQTPMETPKEGSPPPPSQTPPSSFPSEQQSGLPDSLQAALETVRLPREVVETLRDQVFGFDTFFVTDQEPYEGGVHFKGNLRADSATAYAKLKAKLQARFGDAYLLYLLLSPDNERPVAVVVPKGSLEVPPPPVPDWLGALAFGSVSVLTVLLSVSPPPEFGFIPSSDYLLGPLLDGAPAALLFCLGMAAHEAGHLAVARASTPRVDLAVPYFVPSWQLGSFGAITRIKSVLPSRSLLVQLSAAGPLAGALTSILLLLLTLLLVHPDPDSAQAILLDASDFQDSFIVGGLAKLVLGDALADGAKVAVSPLSVAAWSALLVNAVNAIPAGDLDGGRIALALFGRKWASRLNAVSLALLGITGIFNDVALFWFVLIIFLQRGPIAPQSDEVTEPSNSAKLIGAAALTLCFLVYLPFPFSI